jgi:hypothetical protein
LIAAALGTRTIEETKELIHRISNGSIDGLAASGPFGGGLSGSGAGSNFNTNNLQMCYECDSQSDETNSLSNFRSNSSTSGRYGNSSDAVREVCEQIGTCRMLMKILIHLLG